MPTRRNLKMSKRKTKEKKNKTVNLARKNKKRSTRKIRGGILGYFSNNPKKTNWFTQTKPFGFYYKNSNEDNLEYGIRLTSHAFKHLDSFDDFEPNMRAEYNKMKFPISGKNGLPVDFGTSDMERWFDYIKTKLDAMSLTLADFHTDDDVVGKFPTPTDTTKHLHFIHRNGIGMSYMEFDGPGKDGGWGPTFQLVSIFTSDDDGDHLNKKTETYPTRKVENPNPFITEWKSFGNNYGAKQKMLDPFFQCEKTGFNLSDEQKRFYKFLMRNDGEWNNIQDARLKQRVIVLYNKCKDYL